MCQLLEAGQGCTENINLFIRSIGSRVATARGAKKEKLLAKALEIHDKMIEHGFETNEDTYVGGGPQGQEENLCRALQVSLMIACYDEAELARKVYIKMREHLLAPSLKVSLYGCTSAVWNLPCAGESLARTCDQFFVLYLALRWCTLRCMVL